METFWSTAMFLSFVCFMALSGRGLHDIKRNNPENYWIGWVLLFVAIGLFLYAWIDRLYHI